MGRLMTKAATGAIAAILALACPVVGGVGGPVTPACPGDADGDFDVDFDDLNIVLANWAQTVPPGTSGDVTGNGFVDFEDLNLVLANWGTFCMGIDKVFPTAGATGTVVTILGHGFDPDPDNNCAVVMMTPTCSLPLDVLDVNPEGTQMRVQVGPIFQGGQPGPIMVARGNGDFGTFVPAFPEIVVEEPVWVWDRQVNGPAATGPIFDPIPPAEELWLHGEPENGIICLFLPDDLPWLPDQKMAITMRAHDHAQGIGHDAHFPCMRILGPGGNTQECAERICDMIRCAFFQQSGIVIDCFIDQVPGGWKITVSLPGGFIDWGNLDICLFGPEVQVLDFFPPAAQSGDKLTIVGSGFDPDPDNNCAVVMMTPTCSLPLEVISVTPDGRQMQVLVGPIFQGAQPGPIMVATGFGTQGFFTPAFPDILVEQPVWNWDRFPPNGPAGGTMGMKDFVPIPPPEEQWIHGEPENGIICVTIPDSLQWGPDQKLNMTVRAHDHARGIGHDGYFPCIRLIGPGGSGFDCALRICDTIRCSFFQQAGFVIDCQVTPVPGGTKITFSIPGGYIDWGNVDICLVP